MNRPYVLVNVAMTADGKIDSFARKGAAISSIPDQARVDRLRASVDAVLVGGRTLLDKDPKLTVKSLALREERKALGLPENPAKVGVVTVADLNTGGDFMIAGSAMRYIFTTHQTPSKKIGELEFAGASVFVSNKDRIDLEEMLLTLYRTGIRKLLVEGGGTMISEFIRLRTVDELTIYIAPKIFGGASAPTPADGAGFLPEQAPGLKLVSAEKFDIEGGVLLHYRFINTN